MQDREPDLKNRGDVLMLSTVAFICMALVIPDLGWIAFSAVIWLACAIYAFRLDNKIAEYEERDDSD